jgi:hypothetical protein
MFFWSSGFGQCWICCCHVLLHPSGQILNDQKLGPVCNVLLFSDVLWLVGEGIGFLWWFVRLYLFVIQLFLLLNRVSCKVTRLGDKNGQFQHSGASNTELRMKILQNEITLIQTSFSTNFGGKLSFILSFLFLERLHCCYVYIFTAPTCTTTIISLEPGASNAETQHFILRFNKTSLLCRYHWKRG